MGKFNIPTEVRSGRRIPGEAIGRAVENALKAIEYELPEKARTLEVYLCVLGYCKEVLEEDKEIVL